MIICRNCQAQIEDGSRFCTRCGTPVQQMAQEPVQNPVVEQPTFEPVAEPVVEEPTFESVAEPVVEEPTFESVAEPVVEEPTFEPVAEPVVEEPTFESVAEPVVEEPTFEPMAEPVVEEPTFEPMAEPVMEQSMPVFDGNLLTQEMVQNEAAPDIFAAAAPVAALSKQAAKAQKKAAEAALKLQKAEDKKKAKQQKQAKKTQNDGVCEGTPKKKKSVVGIIFALLLTLFLIVNLATVYISSVGAGVAAADTSYYSITIGGEEYALEAFFYGFTNASSDDIMTMVRDYAYSEDSFTIRMPDGTTRRFDDETIEEIKHMVDEFDDGRDEIVKTMRGAVQEAKSAAMLGFVCEAAYAFIVSLITSACIVFALGKSRRALLIPGIVTSLFALAFLAVSIIAMIAPTVFGLATHIFSAAPVLIFDLGVPAVLALVGVIATIIGMGSKEAK